jgi:hypothetical protein
MAAMTCETADRGMGDDGVGSSCVVGVHDAELPAGEREGFCGDDRRAPGAAFGFWGEISGAKFLGVVLRDVRGRRYRT